MRCLPRGNPWWHGVWRMSLRLLALGLVLSGPLVWDSLRAAQTSVAPALEIPVALELLDPQPRAHLSLDGGGVVLPPDGSPARFRLSFDLPDRGPDDSPWQLRFNRVELKELQLQAPGWRPPTQDFFHPQPHDGLLPMAFSQTLPSHWRGQHSVEVTASTELARTLRPQVVRMALGAEQDKQALAVAVALYSSMLMLAFVAISLYLGARQLAFLSFLAFVSTSFLLMLVVNGHAYTLPWLAWLKPLGGQGTNICMLLVSASGICTARDFAGRRPDNFWLRWVPVVGASAMAALAAALLCGFAFAPETMQTLVIVGWAASAVLAMLAFLSAIVRKAWLGWPLLTALIMLGISCTMFELSVRGMAAPFWGRFGYQVGLVLVGVVLVVALIGRIADFRLKHEQERAARKASEQRLALQQVYTDLAGRLRTRLQEVASKDMEWYAAQMAMERLLPWLELSSSGLRPDTDHRTGDPYLTPVGVGRRQRCDLARGGAAQAADDRAHHEPCAGKHFAARCGHDLRGGAAGHGQGRYWRSVAGTRGDTNIQRGGARPGRPVRAAGPAANRRSPGDAQTASLGRAGCLDRHAQP